MRETKLGVMAEFGSPHDLLRAVAHLREIGLRKLDAYTPYPVRELEPLLEIKRSFIPKVVLAAALLGAASAYVCENYACQLPTADPREFARLLTDALIQ